MSYRIECSPNSRAGCQNKPCKDEGIKIEKGEIRFGVYVTIQDHGSFRWKHWGCVSGAQIQGLRDYLEQDDPSTGFKWDFFDGLDELPADQQAKVKTAVIDGKIADEDWKGDPLYNKLGQKGTQPVVRKRKPKFGEEEGEGEEEDTPPSSDEKPAPKKRAPAKKKTTQKTEDGNEDEAETKPAAKKRAPAKKKAVKDEDGEPDEDVTPARPPAKKSAAKKVKNEESGDEEETKPVKKTSAKRTKKAVNKEESGEESAGDNAAAQESIKPTKKTLAKKSAAKKKVKKVYDEDNSGEDEAQAEAKPAPPSRAERASKRAASDPNDENKKPVKRGKTAKPPGKQKTGEGKVRHQCALSG